MESDRLTPFTFYLLPSILLAFALRLVNLGRLGLWGDEAWALYLNHLGLLGLTLETARDVHPPVYHYLSYAWALLAGSGEFALRYLSVAAGTLAVAVTCLLGRQLAGRRVAVWGAALMALAPFSVHYSQEARPYMLALLYSALATCLLLRAAQRPSLKAWAAYAVVSFLAAFTLYSTALWFGMHGLVLLFHRKWRPRFVTWLAIELGVLALAAPWLLIFGGAIESTLTMQGEFTLRAALPPQVLLAHTLTGLLAGVSLPPATAAGLASVVALTGTAGVWVARRPAWRTIALLAALALGPVLALYPIHTRFPWFEPRVLAFCAVPFYLLLAVGLEGWLSRGRGWAVLAGLLVLGAWGVGLYDYAVRFDRYSPEVEDYVPMIAHVQARATPGDVVAYNAPWHVGYFQAYYAGPRLTFQPLASFSIESLGARSAPHQVWVVARDIVRQPGGPKPEDRAEDALSAQAFKVEESWYGQVRLARYALPGAAQEELVRQPVGALFEGGLWLSEFRLQPPLEGDVLTLEPGQAVYLELVWQAGQPLARSYHVFSHIIGPLNPASGNPVWAQHDGVPGNQERPTSAWAVDERVRDPHVMWLDAAARPGEYELEVGVYDPGSGVRLNVTRPGGELSDHLILAGVRVVSE